MDSTLIHLSLRKANDPRVTDVDREVWLTPKYQCVSCQIFDLDQSGIKLR